MEVFPANIPMAGNLYRGYYNYYNIGAVPGGATGSAVANGLIFAKGGSSGKNTSYTRPWMSPVSSITGGAQWIAEKFIKRGQNTIYYERFNTNCKTILQPSVYAESDGSGSGSKFYL